MSRLKVWYIDLNSFEQLIFTQVLFWFNRFLIGICFVVFLHQTALIDLHKWGHHWRYDRIQFWNCTPTTQRNRFKISSLTQLLLTLSRFSYLIHDEFVIFSLSTWTTAFVRSFPRLSAKSVLSWIIHWSLKDLYVSFSTIPIGKIRRSEGIKHSVVIHGSFLILPFFFFSYFISSLFFSTLFSLLSFSFFVLVLRSLSFSHSISVSLQFEYFPFSFLLFPFLSLSLSFFLSFFVWLVVFYAISMVM